MSKRAELEELIDDCAKEMKKCEAGSEGFENAGNILAKLHSLELEYEKLDMEKELRKEQIRNEFELKEKEIESGSKSRTWDRVVTLLDIGSKASLLVWGSLSTWEYEREGIVSSGPGKMFMNALLRFK